jgi:hypothetical protein
MPFGRFKGVLLADLSDQCVTWLHGLDDLREPLRTAVDRGWRMRFESPSSSLTGIEALPADARPMVEELIASGYHSLASRHHPDRGGETKTMQAINAATAWLRRVVRGAPSS